MEERTDPQSGNSLGSGNRRRQSDAVSGRPCTSPASRGAALDSSVFSKVNSSEATPASWEERACKAWKYYLEELLVKTA